MILQAAEAGQGAPVVLLHGLFGRSQNLASVARALAASHRVISLDLRNHGASPHGAGMDYPVQAQDVLETLAALNALPAGLLGHSMGGKVAMAVALVAPGAVSRLLVADIAPVAYAHHNIAVAAAMLRLDLSTALSRAQASAALADAVPDAGVRGFLLQNFIPGAAPSWRIGLAEIAAGMAAIEGWPTFADTARYAGPTLLVAGGRSDYVNSAGLAAMKALFPAADVVTIQNAGHWLHADQPAAFAAQATDFFSKGADST